jgi:hypothetical protein
MTGFLRFDRINKSKNTTSKIDKNFYAFSKMGFPNKEFKNLQNESNAQYHTNPTMKNVATTIVSIGIPDNSLKKKRANRKKIKFKEQFPEKLKKLFGEHFFFVQLKIPKENYYHFLAYCNPLGIEELYKNKKQLEILKILLKESKSFLLLLEKSE